MKRLVIFLLLTAALKASAQTTFSEHVAPVLYASCTNCHHPGGIAPFSLLTYADAYANRFSIRSDVDARVMPPWPPDIAYTRLAHERVLSQQQIDLIKNWVDAGAPRGDSTKAPATPVYTNTSQLPSVDLGLQTPSFTIDAPTDIYQCFVMTSNLATEKFMTGLECLPGNGSAVHHVLIYSDTSGVPATLDQNDPDPGYRAFGGTGSSSSQLIGLWVPGAQPEIYPTGMGVRIPPNASIIAQVHYAPGHLGQKDSTRINLMFSPLLTLRNVYITPALNHGISLVNGPLVIPANTVKTFYSSYTNNLLPVSLLGVGPHMHLIGKSIQSYALRPGNDTLPLVRINDWDFHWQGKYMFRKLLKMPSGTEFRGEATYDNTSNNPNNPNSPPKLVTVGEGTEDEMMLIYFWYLLYKPGDENIVLDSSIVISAPQVKTELPEVQVYPNPAHDRLNLRVELVQGGQGTVALYDLRGMLVSTQPVSWQTGWNQKTMQVNGVSPGMYLLLVNVNGATVRKKVLVE